MLYTLYVPTTVVMQSIAPLHYASSTAARRWQLDERESHDVMDHWCPLACADTALHTPILTDRERGPTSVSMSTTMSLGPHAVDHRIFACCCCCCCISEPHCNTSYSSFHWYRCCHCWCCWCCWSSLPSSSSASRWCHCASVALNIVDDGQSVGGSQTPISTTALYSCHCMMLPARSLTDAGTHLHRRR